MLNHIMLFMLIINLAYIFKSLAYLLVVKFTNDYNSCSRRIISYFSVLLDVSYYSIIFLAYILCRNRFEEFFLNSTFRLIVLFVILVYGFVSVSRHLLFIFLIIMLFPIVIYYFIRNPNNFYSNIGIDPEVVMNLPSNKASSEHSSMCVICSDDINEEEDILILKCPARHYFHSKCIKEWLIRKVNCPVCRCEAIL